MRLLGGKPLIGWSIEHARAVKRIERVIVSTDCQEIADVARQYGAEVPFMRPKNLATDTIGFDAVLLHGIKKLFSMGYDF